MNFSGDIEGAKLALSKIRKATEEEIDKEVQSYVEMNAGQKSLKEIVKEFRKIEMFKRLLVVVSLFLIRSFGGKKLLINTVA